MSYKDNADLRSRSSGGWAYSENVLWDIFIPLIESDGGSVYQALTRLIPRAAIDPDRQVTVRLLEESSCISKSQVQRKLQEIIALGMVTERRYGNRRAATYQIQSLVELAELGREELLRRLLGVLGAAELVKRLRKRGRIDVELLKRDMEILKRLGVPPGDTEEVGHPTDEAAEEVSEATNTASSRGDMSNASSDGPSAVERPPAASGESGVPPGDTNRPAVEMTLVELLVSQGKASVSHTEGSVSHTEASVSQNRGSLFKEEEVEEEEYSPLPLSQAKGGLLPSLNASAVADVLPSPQTSSADRVAACPPRTPWSAPPGNSKSLKPPHDAKELEAAVAKVMRECSLSSRRIGKVIEAAMRVEASKTDELPDWNAIAECMVRAYEKFLANRALMAYKVMAARFFAELWDDGRKWPWDEKTLREEARGRRL